MVSNARSFLDHGDHRGASSVKVGARGRSRSRTIQEVCCCFCGKEATSLDSVIRVQVGEVRYTEGGDEFHQTPFPGGIRSKWVHGGCASSSIHQLVRWDWCQICNEQFSQDVPGTAILLERGAFHTGKLVNRFVTEGAGAFHWACAKSSWDLDLFASIWRVPHGNTKKDRRRYLLSV